MSHGDYPVLFLNYYLYLILYKLLQYLICNEKRRMEGKTRFPYLIFYFGFDQENELAETV